MHFKRQKAWLDRKKAENETNTPTPGGNYLES